MRYTTLFVAVSLLAIAVPADAGLGKVGEDTYRCTVAVGGGLTPAPAPNVGADTRQSPYPLPPAVDANAGGCQATPGPPDTGTVTAIDAADGCAAFADASPAPGGQQALAEGDLVKQGTAIWFYCEAGVTDAANAITIDFGS